LGEFFVGVEVVLLLKVNLCIFGVDAEYLEAGLAIVKIHLLSHKLERSLPVSLSLVDLAALFLHVGQLIVVFSIVFVLMYLLHVVVLGLIELAREQVHVTLVLDVSQQSRAVLVVDKHIPFINGECFLGFSKKIKDCSILQMDEEIRALAFELANLIYVESIEKHFLFFYEGSHCQFVLVDVHKTMIVDVPLLRYLSCLDMDDEEIAIFVGELLGAFQALGGGHEAVHFDEAALLQSLKVSLPQSGSSIEFHGR
jgi:hypothetical protein